MQTRIANRRRGRAPRRRDAANTPARGGQAKEVVKIVYWKPEMFWLGYLQDFPDYWTQGTTVEDLRDHLKDLYKDITSGEIPGIRRVEDLVIS